MTMRYPEVRRTVMQRLGEFAHPARRLDEWGAVDGEFSYAVEDLLHFAGEPDPRSRIGDVFESINQADAAGAARPVLDLVLREVGLPITCDRVSAHPRWARAGNRAGLCADRDGATARACGASSPRPFERAATDNRD